MSSASNVKVLDMSLSEFQTLQYNNPNKVYFLDFMATWCGPCKIIKPFIHETADNCASNNDNIEFYMVICDDESSDEIVQHYNINALPTFMLFKNGKTLSSIVGMKRDDITNAVNAALGK